MEVSIDRVRYEVLTTQGIESVTCRYIRASMAYFDANLRSAGLSDGF